ncbi:MAG: hypothetical protein ACLTX3_08565 [Lachnospiraceae bacterium]
MADLNHLFHLHQPVQRAGWMENFTKEPLQKYTSITSSLIFQAFQTIAWFENGLNIGDVYRNIISQNRRE